MSETELMDLVNGNKVKRAYGIDLGTTNSCISYYDGGEKEPIKLKNGHTTMPSCVMWDGKTDTFTVGEVAKSNKGKSNVMYSVKRLMGTDEIIHLVDGKYEKDFTPIEISSEILKGLVEQASELHRDIKDVVITVPARFNNRQIEDTKKAAELAGLNVLKMLKEPTSAAVAYGLDESVEDDELSLVYDLGGGTFDVSLVRINKGGYNEKDTEFLQQYGLEPKDVGLGNEGTSITVIKTHGNTKLGGDDIDREILGYVLEEMKKQGIDITKIPKPYLDLMQARCERLKTIGMENKIANLAIEYLPIGCKSEDCKVSTTVQVNNDMLEKSIRKIYVKTRDIMNDNLSKSELESIKHIILVGGSTKSTILKNLLKRDFSDVPVNDKFNPDLLVCLGAGVESSRYTNSTADVNISDVIPMSIGVVANGKVSPIIKRYSRIPTKVRRKFTTAEDGQDFISVQIYEGDSSYIQECTYLGDLRVDNIPIGKAGEVVIDVILSIDSDGLLVCKVSVGDVYVDKQLVNVLGKTSPNETEVKQLSVNDKALIRWREMVDKLYASNKDDIAEEFETILDDYEQGNKTLVEVQSFLKENKAKM